MRRRKVPYSAKDAPDVLEEASRETLVEIDRDLDRLSTDLRPLLLEIRQRRFEPGFGAGELKDKWNTEALERLRTELGEPVSRYIAWIRMETASRLVRDTDLGIGDIGELVGYINSSSFSQTFKRWFGMTAGDFRKHIRAAEDEVPRSVFDPLSSRLPRRLARNGHEPEIQLGLFAWLGASDNEQSDERRKFEEAVAEEFWRQLSSLPSATRKKALGTLRFPSLTFFRLLGVRAIEESRHNRYGGVEIAELALAWLDYLPKQFESSRPNLESLAWAWLGNAYRLAEDFANAEQAFERAGKIRSRATIEPRSEAEILLLEGTLRLFQRRFSEAKQLLDRATALSRALGIPELLVQCLLQRSNLFATQSDLDASLLDLRTAEVSLVDLDEPTRKLQLHQTLASTLALTGNWREAEEHLTKAQDLCRGHGHPSMHHHLELVQGIIFHSADKLEEAAEAFQKSRMGMAASGSRGYAALAALELAVLRSQQGDFSEAASLASEALPFFSSLAIDREAQVAVHILRDAIVSGRLSEKTLIAARDQIRRISIGSSVP